MDSEVRRIVGRNVPSTSFEYHVIKLILLIEQEVQEKALVEEMINEMILAMRDLRTWFERQ
jgi:hypothetical protein